MDLQTLYAVTGATASMIGLAQLAAYATGRFERWPLWWGASNMLIGISNCGIALLGRHPDAVLLAVANVAMTAGCVLLVIGVRIFAGRPPHRWTVFAAILGGAVAVWFHPPAAFVPRVAGLSLIFAVFDCAVAYEAGRLAREDNLRSGWIMMVLFGTSAAFYVGRSILLAAGVFGRATLFGAGSGNHAALGVVATGLLMLRGMILLLLAAERNHLRLAALAFHDPLTGALTRSGLRRAMEALLAGRRKGASWVSILLVDVDHFKRINDVYGHEAGDDLIRTAVKAMHAVAPGNGLVARWGGDEFLLMLPGMSAAQALRVAEALREAFATLTIASSSSACTTLSIGVAEGCLAQSSLSTLLREADEALYAVKRNGRDGIRAADGAVPTATSGYAHARTQFRLPGVKATATA